MKKNVLWVAVALLMAIGFGACSNDDDETIKSPTALYAIIKPAEAQLIDITPSDYVLTLDNIVAVNPKTGEFKLKNTKRIDSKAYPIPTQYVIQFYSEGTFLFDAKLNSALSSYLPSGLTFCYEYTDMSGMARYDLGKTAIVSQDGKVVEGNPTSQQELGMQQMYQILQKAGKVSSNIDYDV